MKGRISAHRVGALSPFLADDSVTLVKSGVDTARVGHFARPRSIEPPGVATCPGIPSKPIILILLILWLLGAFVMPIGGGLIHLLLVILLVVVVIRLLQGRNLFR